MTEPIHGEEEPLKAHCNFIAFCTLSRGSKRSFANRSCFPWCSNHEIRLEPRMESGQPPLPQVLLAFHKPFGVLSQFTPDGSPNRPLSGFGLPPKVYALGRLDADSEGLLLLSDEAGLNSRLLDPKHGHARTYWSQVERIPDTGALAQLARGVVIEGYQTLPCRAWKLDPQPDVVPRDPPIRVRKTVPDCWIGLELNEGKNRQVRKMTASVGHPTLRLIRVKIGRFELGTLPPGQWRELTSAERKSLFS